MDDGLFKIKLGGHDFSLSTTALSSATSSINWFYFVFTVACFAFLSSNEKLVLAIWVGITIVFALSYITLLWIRPDVLRSEKYNLEKQRMLIGEKDTGLLPMRGGVELLASVSPSVSPSRKKNK